MTYGISTRTISAPIGTAGAFAPGMPTTKLVPLSIFFLNREGEGQGDDDEQGLYGVRSPDSEEEPERPKKGREPGDGEEDGEDEERPRKGRKASKKKRKQAFGKKGPPQKPKDPEDGGPEPSMKGANESLSEARISEPQKCSYCKNPATKAYIWADGRAYIGVCDKHEKVARLRIEKTNGDKVSTIKPIPQRQTSAAAEQAPVTAPVLTPVKSGATRASTGTMGTGNVARYHVPIGPPLRRVTPIGDEEEERRTRKRRRRKLHGEERDQWVDRLMKLTK